MWSRKSRIGMGTGNCTKLPKLLKNTRKVEKDLQQKDQQILSFQNIISILCKY